jgi:aminoglycoside phosphotransferase family enzyme/predicted kinase
MGDITDLTDPHAYPLPQPSAVELRETHISWVFLTEGEVYKVKKPVWFPFLDFRSRDARLLACEAEVVLNQRLAAGTYYGVVPVRRDSDGKLHVRADGEVVDWAVHMLRLPDALRADSRLAQGSLAPLHIDAIATRIASFHASALDSAWWGAPDVIRRNVRENFSEAAAGIQEHLTPAEILELEAYQLEFIECHRGLLQRRATEGRIREGHGDLRLEHIYIGEAEAEPTAGKPAARELAIIDCVEFAERFRCSDVCSDIAFLSMDFAAHGRVDLAERFVAKYARASQDYELYALVDFYESYRAFIRGKLALLGGSEEARRYFTLALSTQRRSLVTPAVVVVGGTIASGKSTIAEALGERLSAPVIDADRSRKHLLGVVEDAPLRTGPFEGAYTPAVTRSVYAEMMRRARHVLGSGRPVILDASFRTADMRRSARDLAEAYEVPFVMVECRARADVRRARLVERSKALSISDGRLEIAGAFEARFEPMTELGRAQRVIVDTEQPIEKTLERIARSLQLWPHGLVA